MAKNTDAIARALGAGLDGVKGAVPNYGNAVLRDFKAAVSTLYPPPSTPGTPPHLRTGGYMRSLSVKVNGTTVTLYVATGFNRALAVWLEYGTHRNGRPYMLPRPHWRTIPRPSALRHRDVLSKALLKGESGWRRHL